MRKLRKYLKNDTCSCENEYEVCDECTCANCGNFLENMDEHICSNCIKAEDLLDDD